MTSRRRVVAFGGGHGLSASLEALRRVSGDLTAVVTVADDGGSSGRLREEFGVLPPGDLRMALAALAGSDEWARLWAQLYQHRFDGDGPLGGHAVGNVVVTALVDILGDPVAALDASARLLGAAGRVLPLSTVPLDIVPEAVEAIHDADWAVLGPGSWFTSVIPHLLVPDVAKALAGSRARRLVALNLSPQPGETDGFSPTTHLEVLAAHAPDFDVDVVLADESAATGNVDELREAAATLGATLVVAPIACDDGTPRHDPQRLAAAYDDIFTTYGGDSTWR